MGLHGLDTNSVLLKSNGLQQTKYHKFYQVITAVDTFLPGQKTVQKLFNNWKTDKSICQPCLHSLLTSLTIWFINWKTELSICHPSLELRTSEEWLGIHWWFLFLFCCTCSRSLVWSSWPFRWCTYPFALYLGGGCGMRRCEAKRCWGRKSIFLRFPCEKSIFFS